LFLSVKRQADLITIMEEKTIFSESLINQRFR
jgi:hypothetical protein